MSHRPLELPGPAEFIGGILDDLRAANNVVVGLPHHAPPGLDRMIRERAGTLDWTVLNVTGDASPVTEIARFTGSAAPERCRDARGLLAIEGFSRARGFMVSTDVSGWGRWATTVADYADACRAVDPFDRNVFCIITHGVARAELPAPAPCLSVYPWSGVIGLSDMEFYAAGLIPPDTGPQLNRRVRIAVTARLAMWDPEVADRLARETFERTLDPSPLLADLAQDRGWSAESATAEDPWKDGLSDTFDDETRMQHSALLAVAGLGGVIEQRVWSAQVGVLFPYVETRRREILARLRRRLVVPFEAGDGRIIRTHQDLELSHILAQIRRRPDSRDPAWLSGTLDQLVRVRNCLAHFEAVPATILHDTAFHRRDGY